MNEQMLGGEEMDSEKGSQNRQTHLLWWGLSPVFSESKTRI